LTAYLDFEDRLREVALDLPTLAGLFLEWETIKHARGGDQS